MVSTENNQNWMFDCGLLDDVPVPGGDLPSLGTGYQWPTHGFPLPTGLSSEFVDSFGNSDGVKECGTRKRVKSGSCNASDSKACREKMRRDRLNDRFQELSSILEPGRPPKLDKAVVLSDAVRMVNHLRDEAKKLKESHEVLQDKINELKAEKNELRDEKQKLKAEKETLEQQVKALHPQPGFLPSAVPPPFAGPGQFCGGKMVPFMGYPGVSMWQFTPPAAVDTTQDHGCDGSVLLNSTRNNQAEKDAFPNLSLRGFQIIDRAKSEVEKACPVIVSCADIIALAARDATVALKGPYWNVETGRRDGRVSTMNEALDNLPSSLDNITTLLQEWQRKGLSRKDLVVLSGGHTVGTSHCNEFTNRLYNFTGKGDMDPSLDSRYIVKLKEKCKPNDYTTLVEMDPGSYKTFDESYYELVLKRRGLFQSDSALLDDHKTRTYVEHQVDHYKSSFFKDFGVSMVKMGRVQVLTGDAGEIRKVCSRVN